MVALNYSSLRTRGRDTYVLHGEGVTAFFLSYNLMNFTSVHTIKPKVQSSIIQRENVNTGGFVCTQQNSSRHFALILIRKKKFFSILKHYPEEL